MTERWRLGAHADHDKVYTERNAYICIHVYIHKQIVTEEIKDIKDTDDTGRIVLIYHTYHKDKDR